MAKAKVEDPLIHRSRALRGESDAYAPIASRRLRGMQSFERDLSQMRSSIGLDVAAMTPRAPGSNQEAFDQAMGRARTLSTAAMQGEGQLRMANLQTRAMASNQAIGMESHADSVLSNHVRRQHEFRNARRQARDIRSAARTNAWGTAAGGLVAAATTQQGMDFFRGLGDRFDASAILRRGPIASTMTGAPMPVPGGVGV